MLVEFKFSNYRSFRDEAILSMEAVNVSKSKDSLITYNSLYLLPSVAIYGKNGGGKSNVIRAFWLAVQFVRNAQRTQHANAGVPVSPFLLNDYSKERVTSFEFTYIWEGIKYIYGFSSTQKEATREYLYYFPKKKEALVFDRIGQSFIFRTGTEKKKRELISQAVASNQLFFAVACTMNERICVDAMGWFNNITFSRGYTDIPAQLLAYSEDPHMLQAISDYAKAADVGIQDMKFDIKSTGIEQMPNNLPEGIKQALMQFAQALAESSEGAEAKLKMEEVHASTYHRGVDKTGVQHHYQLALEDESDGTRRIMSLAPMVEKALRSGGVLLVDELEKEIHPLLMQFVISKFQNPKTNPNNAQMIFTTHNTDILDMDIMRKDQLYFVDKDDEDGSSTLYSIADFFGNKSENIRKGYLLGKYGAIPNIDIGDDWE